MRITWFGAVAFRLYVGGKIIVVGAESAPKSISQAELRAGADQIIGLPEDLDALAQFTQKHWVQRHARRVLEDETPPSVRLYALDDAAIVIDSEDDPRLLIALRDLQWDRFADDAIIVLVGVAANADNVRMIAEKARPKLIALASDGVDDSAFAEMADACGNCALQVLEPALALEA